MLDLSIVPNSNVTIPADGYHDIIIDLNVIWNYESDSYISIKVILQYWIKPPIFFCAKTTRSSFFYFLTTVGFRAIGLYSRTDTLNQYSQINDSGTYYNIDDRNSPRKDDIITSVIFTKRLN